MRSPGVMRNIHIRDTHPMFGPVLSLLNGQRKVLVFTSRINDCRVFTQLSQFHRVPNEEFFHKVIETRFWIIRRDITLIALDLLLESVEFEFKMWFNQISVGIRLWSVSLFSNQSVTEITLTSLLESSFSSSTDSLALFLPLPLPKRRSAEARVCSISEA